MWLLLWEAARATHNDLAETALTILFAWVVFGDLFVLRYLEELWKWKKEK